MADLLSVTQQQYEYLIRLNTGWEIKQLKDAMGPFQVSKQGRPPFILHNAKRESSPLRVLMSCRLVEVVDGTNCYWELKINSLGLQALSHPKNSKFKQERYWFD